MSSMIEPSCPCCYAEKFRGMECSACGFGKFPFIEAIQANGMYLGLTELYPTEGHRAYFATLVHMKDGETRDQKLIGRLPRGWRETAERRMMNDPDTLTPKIIVSMK